MSASGRRPVHVSVPASRGPWVGVAVLAVTNLLPLVLVLTGSLDLPLLVVCYLVEAVLVTLRPALGRRRRGHDEGPPPWQSLGGQLAFALVLVIVGATAIGATRWDRGALLVLGVTVLLFLGGLRAAGRTGDAGETEGKRWLLTWGWHLAVVFVGSLVAVPYMQDLTLLRVAGWEPSALGDYLLGDAGVQVNTWMLGSGLAPEVLGTAIFVLFKTFNEVVMAARRALLAGPRTVRPGAGGPR